jgi:DNA-binding response OmpR family regulator
MEEEGLVPHLSSDQLWTKGGSTLVPGDDRKGKTTYAMSKEGPVTKILVIDDEQHIRELYSLELINEGYSVDSRASCANLLSAIEHSKPDLIVLDIRLVDSDGLEVLLQLRQTYPDLPVIMCSAYDSYRYDVRAMAADAYVVKSFDLSELKLKVQRALDGRAPERLSLLPRPNDTRNGNEQTTSNVAI